MLSDFPDPRLDDAANLVRSGALCVPGDRDRMQQDNVDAGESDADRDDLSVAISSTGANTDDLCRHLE